MPTYPFERSSHWLPEPTPSRQQRECPTPAANQQERAAFALERGTDDGATLEFGTAFSGKEYFLRDHRIAGKSVLPGAVYVALALGAVLPVLLIPGVTEARGFYLFAILSALAYAALLAVIIVQDQSRARPKRLRRWQDLGVQLGALALVSALIVEAGMLRGTEALHALSTGLQPLQLTREIYRVSGAGSSEKGEILFRFAPEWTGTGQ